MKIMMNLAISMQKLVSLKHSKRLRITMKRITIIKIVALRRKIIMSR